MLKRMLSVAMILCIAISCISAVSAGKITVTSNAGFCGYATVKQTTSNPYTRLYEETKYHDGVCIGKTRNFNVKNQNSTLEIKNDYSSSHSIPEIWTLVIDNYAGDDINIYMPKPIDIASSTTMNAKVTHKNKSQTEYINKNNIFIIDMKSPYWAN